MSDDEPIAYRYADADLPESERRFDFDAPRRHLTARDVARMPPAVLKRITGGARPLYVTAPEVGKDGAPNFAGMTRAEVDAYAVSIGIADAADLPNKPAVIAAIEQHAPPHTPPPTEQDNTDPPAAPDGGEPPKE